MAASPNPFTQGVNTVNQILRTSGIRRFSTIEELVFSILQFLLGFLAIIALVVLIYGGLLFLLSAGDEDKAKKGKQVVLYAIIGLLIIGFSALIVNLILSFIT